MKRILSIFLLFSFTLSAQVPDEVHEKCKDVADYVGCVQIFTGSVVTKKETGIPEVKELKKALGLLPSRLQNTSLNNLSTSIQPFTDALAKAELAFKGFSDEDYSLEERNEIGELYLHGVKIDAAIDIYRETRYSEIDYESESSVNGLNRRYCSRYDNYVFAFNSVFETNYLEYEKINDRAFGDSGDCYIRWADERYRSGGKSSSMISKTINYIGDVLQGIEPIEEEVKTLQQLKDAYVEKIQIETKNSISKYKEIFISEKNTWVMTENLNNFSKRDFRRDRNAMNKIKATRGINANAIIAIGYVNDHGPKLNQINSWKEYLVKFYNYDFEIAKKNGNASGTLLGSDGKMHFLLQHALALANELVITSYGDKKSNQKDARDILISMLSMNIDNCIECFDNGRPTLWYSSFIYYRNEAERLLKTT